MQAERRASIEYSSAAMSVSSAAFIIFVTLATASVSSAFVEVSAVQESMLPLVVNTWPFINATAQGTKL